MAANDITKEWNALNQDLIKSSVDVLIKRETSTDLTDYEIADLNGFLAELEGKLESLNDIPVTQIPTDLLIANSTETINTVNNTLQQL